MDDLRSGIAQRAKASNTPREQQRQRLCLIFLNNLCNRFLILAIGKPERDFSALFPPLTAESRFWREFSRVQRSFLFELAHGNVMERKVNVHFFLAAFPRTLHCRLHASSKRDFP